MPDTKINAVSGYNSFAGEEIDKEKLRKEHVLKKFEVVLEFKERIYENYEGRNETEISELIEDDYPEGGYEILSIEEVK
jgi:hypothetical protein